MTSRSSTLLLAGAGFVVGLIFLIITVWFLPWWLSLILAIVIGALVALWIHNAADALILKRVGGRPLPVEQAPVLHNLVDGLSVSHGFSSPDLSVIDDNALNAMVVGRTPEQAHIVVTRGLIDNLSTIELEGVMAHLLSRVATGDTYLATRVAVVIGMLLAPFTGLARSLGGRFLGSQRSVLADLEGVKLTRYPPGLGNALAKMERDGRVVKHDPLAVRHLWINMPPESLAPAEFALTDRIALLHEL